MLNKINVAKEKIRHIFYNQANAFQQNIIMRTYTNKMLKNQKKACLN